METTAGTIIGLHPLTETSLIVAWCSRDCGLVRTVARGARRPGSPFAGRLDLYFGGEFAFARSRRSDLHALREVEIGNPRFGLRQSYDRTLAAAYFARLIERVAEPETPIAALYDLLSRALDHLAEKEPTLRVVGFFESEVARLLGVGGGGPPERILAELCAGLPSQRQVLLQRLRGG